MEVATSRKPRLSMQSGFWHTYAGTHHRNAPKYRPVPHDLLLAARGWVKARNRTIGKLAALTEESK